MTTYAGQPLPSALEPETPHSAHRGSSADEALARCPASYLWAALLARIYECFPLLCPRCGNEMRLIAFITEPASVKPILEHLGLPTEPPRVAPARGPPDPSFDFDQRLHHDSSAPEPTPEYEFDQRVSW